MLRDSGQGVHRNIEANSLSVVQFYSQSHCCRICDSLEAFLDEIGKSLLPENLTLALEGITVSQTPAVWECVVTHQHSMYMM